MSIAPNQFKAESENGAAVISGNVKKIVQNSLIIENLNITFAAPATKADVTDVKTYLAAEPVETAVTTTTSRTVLTAPPGPIPGRGPRGAHRPGAVF